MKPTLWSNRDFTKLWAGQTVSKFGTHITGAAMAATASVHFLTTLVSPAGAVTAGLLATQIGIRATLLIAALGMLSATAWLLFSPVRRLHET